LAMTMEFLHRNSYPRRETRAPVAGEASRTLLDGKPGTAENIPRKIFRQDALSQEAGGSNCLWTDDTSLWRRHSTSSSATVTLEAKATKHPPAMSNNSKPTKLLRSQITLAIEHIQMTSGSTPLMICRMILPPIPPPQIPPVNWGIRKSTGQTGIGPSH